MSLDAIISAAESREKKLVVYADGRTDLPERLSTWNVSVHHRALAPAGADPFVILEDETGYRGTLTLGDFDDLLSPPIDRSLEPGSSDPVRDAVLEMLDDTLFRAASRRELLATTREFEDRAERVGRGHLAVGFQRQAAFVPQAEFYRRLALQTDLDIHVYMRMAEEPIEEIGHGLDLHTEPAEIVDRYWFLLFDGDGHDDRKWGFVARQQTDDEYSGVWTYDPNLVDLGFSALE